MQIPEKKKDIDSLTIWQMSVGEGEKEFNHMIVWLVRKYYGHLAKPCLKCNQNNLPLYPKIFIRGKITRE